MRFYLKWINPVVAILILVICSWLYFGGYFVNFKNPNESVFGRGFNIIDPAELSLPMYFFAKGLFSSSMLFLFGEFLKRKVLQPDTENR